MSKPNLRVVETPRTTARNVLAYALEQPDFLKARDVMVLYVTSEGDVEGVWSTMSQGERLLILERAKADLLAEGPE